MQFATTPTRGSSTDGFLLSLYESLKLRAHVHLQHEARPSCQTTALVHDAYIRLCESDMDWQSEAHFLNAASLTMRRILVDHARARQTSKRGGAWSREPLEGLELVTGTCPEQTLAIHDALEHYADREPVKAKLVELRIFAGLSLDAAAVAIGVSRATAKRYWSVAKLQLVPLLED